MERIIKELNSEILESLNYSFDGFYWVHPVNPIKLQSTDVEGTYIVILDGGDITNNPDPVKSNTDLLRLIVALVQPYIQAHMQNASMNNIPVDSMFLTNILKQYFDFRDERIKFRVGFSQVGLNLAPENEFTFTLLEGLQCEFKVIYSKGPDSENIVEAIYTHPQCMSTRYLKSLFGDDIVIKQLSVLSEDGFEPFYGIGLV